MKIISHNQQATVGLVIHENHKSDFVGIFNPTLLKAWAEEILEKFGDDPVFLYVHKGQDPTPTDPKNNRRYLTATVEHGDDMQMVVAGFVNDEVFGGKRK